MRGGQAADGAQVLLRTGAEKRESHGTEVQIDQAAAVGSDDVVVPFGCRLGENAQHALVQADRGIESRCRFGRRLRIGKEDLGRTALVEDLAERALVEIGERLGDEDDGGVELAQLAKPGRDAFGEERMGEKRPGLFENDQGRAPVEPLLDPPER